MDANVTPTVLRLGTNDTVAVALRDLAPGTPLIEAGASDLEHGETLRAREPIGAGHKVAVRAMARGAPVLKYGQVIGHAAADVPAGAHVHVHNLEVRPAARGAEIGSDLRRPPQPAREASFRGYVRDDGRVGTRNYIAVLTSVNCSATVARKVAEHFTPERLRAYTNVDGVAAFTHTTGCGTTPSGDGLDNLQRTLAGYATHPNFWGALIVGLGCEVNQVDPMLARFDVAPGPRLRSLSIQEAGGTRRAIERGIALVEEMLPLAAAARRESVPASHLVVGLQCGGSDGYSGITANPALGAASDLLVAHGGTAILAETPEIYGAENLLLRRAASPQIAAKLIERLEWWERHVAANGAQLDNNPSPGNIAGGLSSILEKSLGAVAKSGTSALVEVYRYGERVDARGFVFMDSPGYDPCSATGQIAAGANLICFTTGRGSVFGSIPAPTLKLASNARLAAHMAEDIDVDCSAVLEGRSIAEMGHVIFERMLAVASGEQTASESLGFGAHEFVPWQIGATL
jgi:altronate hydrolase